MLPVFESVSADPAGAVYRRGEELRRDGFSELITLLARTAPLRPGISHVHAVDLLFVLLDPPLYRSLVIESNWPEHEWAAWVTTTLLRDLFGRAVPPSWAAASGRHSYLGTAPSAAITGRLGRHLADGLDGDLPPHWALV
ncbi:MAG: hypothetical protein ACT4O0_15605 [Pseudonocardia sp.]